MRALSAHRAAAAMLLAVVTVTGCTAEFAPAEVSELTLVETKSPVQLLQNEAASRLSATAVVSGVETVDSSIACRTVEDDPAGRFRQWQSTTAISAAGSLAIARDLSASFVAEDWSARESANDADAFRAVLSKPSSTASIHLDADGSHLEIWVNGPCVETDGADSDEVTSLEHLN